MNKTTLKLIFLGVGTSLFTLLFWKETMGINLVLFSIFLVLSLRVFYGKTIFQGRMLVVLLCLLLLLVAVVYHNSTFSKFVVMLSLAMLVGFSLQSQLKAVHYALLTAGANFVLAPFNMLESAKQRGNNSPKLRKSWRYIRLIVIPVLLLTLFVLLYRAASPFFEALMDSIAAGFGRFVARLFIHFPWGRIFFTLTGFLLIAGVLVNGGFSRFAQLELLQEKTLKRSKRKRLVKPPLLPTHVSYRPPSPHNKMLGLLNENRIGLMSLVALNALLLLVNVLEIRNMWFGFEASHIADFTQMVHNGTFLLILSILLSISVLLYFFRGNQNFFANNKWLKYLAYAWLAQNAVMVISVCLRTSRYIDYFGLAYKRIGVYIFLALTLFGLFTLCLKIWKCHTSSHLLKQNMWAAYLLVAVAALVDWDTTIMQYNVEHKRKELMNVPYMLNLSDKTLPWFAEHPNVFSYRVDEFYSRQFSMSENYPNHYDGRVQAFLERMEHTSWLSWNYAEQKTLDYYENKAGKKD